MKKYTLLGVEFEPMTQTAAISCLTSLCQSARGAAVFTPNSLILHKASRDRRLVSLLNNADLLLPDGAGVSLACRICGLPRCQRIAGIDAAYELLRYAEKNGLSVYLLGGDLGVAHAAAVSLKKRLSRLNVCGTHHGYFDKASHSGENQRVLSDIRRASPDILFVCFGFPVQEAWIQANKARLPSVRLFMGLGGSLDVWSGNVRRAPAVMQRAGLEWLWRCLLEPRRFLDAASLPLFLIEAKSKCVIQNQILQVRIK
ncbi:MAG: WecB/TagA/CpsF family glycosyltransferase [Clostridia bacterium]|nr:WecB/TagA/CpsF family glycosyltransferase [Clostridia bacterium]